MMTESEVKKADCHKAIHLLYPAEQSQHTIIKSLQNPIVLF